MGAEEAVTLPPEQHVCKGERDADGIEEHHKGSVELHRLVDWVVAVCARWVGGGGGGRVKGTEGSLSLTRPLHGRSCRAKRVKGGIQARTNGEILLEPAASLEHRLDARLAVRVIGDLDLAVELVALAVGGRVGHGEDQWGMVG